MSFAFAYTTEQMVTAARDELRSSFPTVRPRRLRTTPAIRALVRETELRPDDFIYPLVVTHGRGVRQPSQSMPGVFQLSVDQAVEATQRAAAAGIRAVLLFGIPESKDPVGLENFDPEGVVQQAIAAIKRSLPEIAVVTDVC